MERWSVCLRGEGGSVAGGECSCGGGGGGGFAGEEGKGRGKRDVLGLLDIDGGDSSYRSPFRKEGRCGARICSDGRRRPK